MDLSPLQVLLCLSLMSPVAEAFPNLHMSWWAPSNGRLADYLSSWRRRVAVVLSVWLPIVITLSVVVETPLIVAGIGVLVFSAFALRLRQHDRALMLELETGELENPAGMWSSLPEVLYMAAFSTIGAVLFSSVPDWAWLVVTGVLLIFTGAAMMARYRRGLHHDLRLDVLGRAVFVVGFLINLYNLQRA